MFPKILTGAYTDVERGALDFAVSRGIACGGWAPLGWLKKFVPGREVRGLQEVPHGGSPNYAERNILDADGTLLITEGEPTGAGDLVQNFARRYRRPLLQVDLEAVSRFQAARALAAWVEEMGIEVLYVTGGAAAPVLDLGLAAHGILQAAWHLLEIRAAMQTRPPPETAAVPPRGRRPPGTLDEALEALDALLGLREKIRIARTAETDLGPVVSSLGAFIDTRLGWWRHNDALIAACRSAGAAGGQVSAPPDEVLIRALWRRLRKSHGLRLLD